MKYLKYVTFTIDSLWKNAVKTPTICFCELMEVMANAISKTGKDQIA